MSRTDSRAESATDRVDLHERSVTSLSLLAKLREDGDAGGAWEDFVRRYQPRVFQWCRRWGLQDSDAQDVSQNVMLELSKQMRTFEYQAGGRFRAWLRTVTRRAWYDFTHRRKRLEFQAAESDLWKKIASQDAESDLLQTLDDECHRELLQHAMTLVRARVKPETWQSFEQTEIKGRPAAEVATELEVQRASVYVARGRVQKMIVAEVKRLDSMTE